MKIILFAAVAAICFSSCKNGGDAKKPFCDTTCSGNLIKLEGNSEFKQVVTISLKNCNPDTVSWTHGKTLVNRQIQLTEYLDKQVKINPKALSAGFQDTSIVWLAFNDCITGRAYLLKLPYSQSQGIGKMNGALNSFDPKFSVDPDLRAYTDRGNIYVVNVNTGKEAQMTFKEAYQDMDFDDIHKVVDTINVTKKRVFVRLLKDGKNVDFEKNIEL
jgi:hypothetical protein